MDGGGGSGTTCRALYGVDLCTEDARRTVGFAEVSEGDLDGGREGQSGRKDTRRARHRMAYNEIHISISRWTARLQGQLEGHVHIVVRVVSRMRVLCMYSVRLQVQIGLGSE